MRLERIRINRYGPFQADVSPTGGIQLIHGVNESGKSLLTESVLGLLTGEKPPDARVDEPVSGFVVVSDEEGTHRLDSDDTLLEYYATEYGYEFTPGEFRNIFVIRDADLKIAEHSIYESVTDRITGLRTAEIRELQSKIRDGGRLTETLQLKNSQNYNYPKKQREQAQTLRDELQEYIDEARQTDIGTVERRLLEAKRRRRTVESTISDLRVAREQEHLQNLRETLDSLRQNIQERERLPGSTTVEPLRTELEAVSEKEAEEEELGNRKEHFRTIALGALGVSLLTFITLIIMNVGAGWALIPLLALGLSGYASYQWRDASNSIAALNKRQSSLLDDAREAGIQAESVDELHAKLGEIERERSRLNQEINQEHGVLTASLDLRREETAGVIKEAEDTLSKRIQQLDTVEVEFSEEALQQRQDELEDLHDEIETLNGVLEAHRDQLSNFRDRSKSLNFEYFTGKPLELQISSIEALEMLDAELETFVQCIDDPRETAEIAHEVLEEMEKEEGQKVETLFGKDSRATDIFERITETGYESVRYDSETDQIVVQHADRGNLTPHELSKGTTDQLYFSIRVGLAEQLLGGHSGFFILDDAFLTSDPERLDRQVDILKELATEGWQLIYLTAKPDAIKRLKNIHANNPIELPRL